MIVLDANILLYAHDADSAHHHAASAWLEGIVASDETIGVPLVTALAFLRISTSSVVFRRPLTTVEAIARLEALLARSNVVPVEPTTGHWGRLAQMASAGQATGSLLIDAHLATLAVEHGAALATSDRDFRRFDDVRLIDPTS